MASAVLLALVLDLTRRLVQANPEMDNPVAEAEAVVLIDEIDLHLHPSWQRLIIHNLTDPRFHAVSSLPRRIHRRSSGKSNHHRIHVMTDAEVYSPTHSFGVDSSRILDEIMDAESRTKEAQDLLSRVSE